MSGIAGGELDESSLRELLDGLTDRDSGPSWRHEHGDFGIGIHYDEADPKAATTWSDGSRAGVVFGAVTNLPELGLSPGEMFERLLDRPSDTAEALEGSFLVAVNDAAADRYLVVTDKLGARTCFYTAEGGFQFATAVDVLMPYLDEQRLNRQTAVDMMLLGHAWGEGTLVEGIKTVRPASVLEYDGEERTLTRYWKPDYTEAEPGRKYIVELARRYRQAVRRHSRMLPSEAGIWLSGGLDSRTTAAALLDERSEDGLQELRAYTYNANPPTNDNPELASQVAQRLGIPLEQVPLSAETVGENFERMIEATDGMTRWNTTVNLSATYSMKHISPVMVEGMQGELVGDHPYRHHLTDYDNVVDSLLSSEAETGVKTVEKLFDVDVDPLATLKEEAKNTPETSVREQALDMHFQNYYARHTLASNRLMRERGGSRVIQADGDYLEWCAKLPHSYRKGAIPLSFTPDGGIPLGTSRAKLALTRALSPQLADVPYERTKVKPSWPYPAHIAGFVGNVAVNRLRSKPTYGNGQLADFWIRDEDTLVHDYVADLVDSACKRDLFNGDMIRDLYDAQMNGKNNAPKLAQITTIEYWVRNHLD